MLEGRLVATLQAILDAEVAQGNTIREVGAWPPRCALVVILKQKFSGDYSSLPNVVYRLIDDSPYWYAEYESDDGSQSIACGFA